jgi:hypothetical protein
VSQNIILSVEERRLLNKVRSLMETAYKDGLAGIKDGKYLADYETAVELAATEIGQNAADLDENTEECIRSILHSARGEWARGMKEAGWEAAVCQAKQ